MLTRLWSGLLSYMWGKGTMGKDKKTKRRKARAERLKMFPVTTLQKSLMGCSFVTQDISRIRACDIIQENVPFSASAIMMLRSLHMHFCLLFLPRLDTHF